MPAGLGAYGRTTSMSLAHADFADFLADGGQIVGGGAAFGAAVTFVAGMLARDLGHDVDALRWAERGAAYGGVAGIGALLSRAIR